MSVGLMLCEHAYRAAEPGLWILWPAAVLLIASGILTYIFRRRKR